MTTREQVEKRIAFLRDELEAGRVDPDAAKQELAALDRELRQLDAAADRSTPAGSRRSALIVAAVLFAAAAIGFVWWRYLLNGDYTTTARVGDDGLEVVEVDCDADGSLDLGRATRLVLEDDGRDITVEGALACEAAREERDGFAPTVFYGSLGLAVAAAVALWWRYGIQTSSETEDRPQEA